MVFWDQIRVDMVKSGQFRANMPKLEASILHEYTGLL